MPLRYSILEGMHDSAPASYFSTVRRHHSTAWGACPALLHSGRGAMLPVMGPAVSSAAWVACPCAPASSKVCMTLLQLVISALYVGIIRRPGVRALRSRTLGRRAMLPVVGPAVSSAAWVARPCATASRKVCMTLLQLVISAPHVNIIRRPGVPASRSYSGRDARCCLCCSCRQCRSVCSMGRMPLRYSILEGMHDSAPASHVSTVRRHHWTAWGACLTLLRSGRDARCCLCCACRQCQDRKAVCPPTYPTLILNCASHGQARYWGGFGT